MYFVGTADSPAQGDDDADLIGGDHAGFGGGDLQSRVDAGPGLATLEDFTSLRRTVSARSRPPPQVTAFNAPPFEVGRQQRHERFYIAIDGAF
jgi:hypothetical protein